MAISFNPAVTSGDELKAVSTAASTAVAETVRSTANKVAQPEDTTALSSSNDSVTNLTQAAIATGATRASRVDALKQAVSNNQYSLDPGKIADALVNSDL